MSQEGRRVPASGPPARSQAATASTPIPRPPGDAGAHPPFPRPALLYSDDELRRISLCRPDALLEPGEDYFDISHPEQGIIRVHQERKAPADACYVARTRISDELWHKLISAKAGPMRQAG